MVVHNDIAYITIAVGEGYWSVVKFEVECEIVTIDVCGIHQHISACDIFKVKSGNTGLVIYD